MKKKDAIDSLPSRGHKIGALAVLVALVLVGYGLLIYPAFSLHEKNAQRLDSMWLEQKKLAVATRKIARLKKEIQFMQAEGMERENFLENESPTIVMADLQKKIKSLVVENGGHLLSMQPHDLDNEGLFPKVRASIDAVFDIRGLRDMLLEISAAEPVLFIENISVQAAWHAGESGGTQAQHRLRVQLDISGYMYTGAAQIAGVPE